MCVECKFGNTVCKGNVTRQDALRAVLASTVDRNSAALYLGNRDAVSLWPASLYGQLAEAALASRRVWSLCQRHVDAALAPLGHQFDHKSPSELGNLFTQGRDVLTGIELAALLWTLLKRDEPALDKVTGRLQAEFEIVALQRLTLGQWMEETITCPNMMANR